MKSDEYSMRDNVRYELRGQNLYCIDLNMNSDGGPTGGVVLWAVLKRELTDGLC